MAKEVLLFNQERTEVCGTIWIGGYSLWLSVYRQTQHKEGTGYYESSYERNKREKSKLLSFLGKWLQSYSSVNGGLNLCKAAMSEMKRKSKLLSFVRQ